MSSQKEGREKKLQIEDGTAIKVKTPLHARTRPVYNCKLCNVSFPSQLDLEEHRKVDHAKKASIAA
jgi:hypothetical protein